MFVGWHRTMISLVFLGVFLLNALFLFSPFLGGILAISWLTLCGYALGTRLAPQESAPLRTAYGAFIALSGIIVILGAWYYVFPFTLGAAVPFIILTTVGCVLLGRPSHHGFFASLHDRLKERAHAVPGTVWVLAITTVLALVACWHSLITLAKTDSVRTAWTTGTSGVMGTFLVAAIACTALLVRGREKLVSLLLVGALLATVLAASVLLFPIGYGFDPFLHRATVNHIIEHGTISPKPLYYAGAYALETITALGFHLPVEILDPWLIPALAALLLPLLAFYGLSHILVDRRATAAALIGLLLLPLAVLIPTTPQGLANLLALMTVFASLPFLAAKERPLPTILLLPALAACAIHPIAGIPTLLYVSLLLADPTLAKWPKVATATRVVILVAGGLLLPASFMANAVVSGTGTGLDLANLNPTTFFASLNLGLFFQNGFRPLLDGAYIIGKNAVPALLLIAALTIVLMKTWRKALFPSVAVAGVLLVNYLLLSTVVDFSFLIDYERQNYAQRLIPLAAFFAAPAFLAGLGTLLSRAHRSEILVRLASVLYVALAATALFYMAYPRDDAHERGRAFNTSQSDVNTVYEIERSAGGRAYAVLANQSVSAAAVRTLGFTRYYGDLFFYPIPTGGDLYSRFLAMNDAPSREIAGDAARLLNEQCTSTPGCVQAPVESVFYAVNAYWWQSDRIIETSKNIADDWFAIDNGAVTVFRFDVK